MLFVEAVAGVEYRTLGVQKRVGWQATVVSSAPGQLAQAQAAIGNSAALLKIQDGNNSESFFFSPQVGEDKKKHTGKVFSNVKKAVSTLLESKK